MLHRIKLALAELPEIAMGGVETKDVNEVQEVQDVQHIDSSIRGKEVQG